LSIGERFLKWREIGPHDVFNQRHFEHSLRRGFLDDDGHRGQAGQARCPPAALAGD